MSAIIRGQVISSRYDNPRHSDRTHADAHAWANRIRAEMGWGLVCGDPAHMVDTPFRRTQKWPPVDECKLRDRARRQIAEHTEAVTQ